MAAWDQLPNESNRWYARFERFRLRGPKRSLEAVFRLEQGLEADEEKRPGHVWYVTARKFDWWGRASAWDATERERIRGLEVVRRFDERERRLSLIDKMLSAVERAIVGAEVDAATKEEAREMFPTLRLFLRDLIGAQRVELGEGLDGVSGDDGGVTFTADDLAAATRMVGRDVRLAQLRDVLAELYPDESSSRRIAQAAGLNLSRVRFQATAVDTWHGVLTEAEHAGRVEAVIAVVEQEYGRNGALRSAVLALRRG